MTHYHGAKRRVDYAATKHSRICAILPRIRTNPEELAP